MVQKSDAVIRRPSDDLAMIVGYVSEERTESEGLSSQLLIMSNSGAHQHSHGALHLPNEHSTAPFTQQQNTKTKTWLCVIETSGRAIAISALVAQQHG